ncbi:MAG: hypothetical protein ACIARR_09480, partial [Phycisphaerales bacterium JB059]
SADELFERHIEAIGGRDAVFAQTSRRITGIYEGPPFDFAVRLTIWQDAPDNFHLRLAEPAGASMDIGYDGETGWRYVSGSSAQALSGQDLTELRQTADFYGEANYKERYPRRQTFRQTTVADRSVYLVAVQTEDGREIVVMFDVESGLFAGTRTKFVDPAGATREMISLISEYEDAGGVLYPRRIEQLIGGLEKRIVYKYRTVEVNVDNDNHDYSMPSDG